MLARAMGSSIASSPLSLVMSTNRLGCKPCFNSSGTFSSKRLALVNAIECDRIWGETFNLAGGNQCRTTYREYLNDMMEIFGLGRNFLPEEGFAEKDFHCGYMDTEKSQNLLQYQKHTLDDYYKEVKKKIGPKKYFIPAIKWMIRLNLLKRSEPYRRHRFFKKKMGSFTVSENKLIRKILAANFNRIELLEEKIETLEKLTSMLFKRENGISSTDQAQSI